MRTVRQSLHSTCSCEKLLVANWTVESGPLGASPVSTAQALKEAFYTKRQDCNRLLITMVNFMTMYNTVSRLFHSAQIAHRALLQAQYRGILSLLLSGSSASCTACVMSAETPWLSCCPLLAELSWLQLEVRLKPYWLPQAPWTSYSTRGNPLLAFCHAFTMQYSVVMSEASLPALMICRALSQQAVRPGLL